MLPENAVPDYHAAGVREDNLLRKIWRRPRATLRYILAYCPDKYVTALLVLGGIVRSLDRAQRTHMGDHMSGSGVLVSALLLGGLSGLITYYFYSWGLELVGRWLGGRADAKTFRTVIAWAMVPTVLTLLTTGLEYCLVGDQLFQSADDDATFGLLSSLLALVEVVLTVWTVVIFAKGTMLVQEFALGRALLNMVLPGAVLVALIAGIVGAYKLFEVALT